MSNEIPIAAYFQPQDHLDPHRMQEVTRRNLPPLPSEMQLLRNAKPLFSGHTHPTYSIDGGTTTEWVDTDPDAIAMQRELAVESGIGAWIVNAYIGYVNGQHTIELQRPLNEIAKQADDRLNFCIMSCLSLPRLKLPVGVTESSRDYERLFDLTLETFKAIIDYSIYYWENSHYFHMNGANPYLTLYGLRNPTTQKLLEDHPNIVSDVLEYSHKTYGVDPYLTANAYTPAGVQQLHKLGFQHVTTYSYLPDFFEGNHHHGACSQERPPDLQSYDTQLEKRLEEARMINVELGISGFNPSVVVGWDASSRGEAGVALDEVSGKFPHTPIIIDATPDKFAHALHMIREYQMTYLPPEERIITVFAWNEFGNGASLIPRLMPDGSIDRSYIDILRRFVKGETSSRSSK